MANKQVTVPDIGDFDSVPVIEVLVADGDTVEAEQPLIVLESDKATMEIPSPGAGVVRGLKLKEGDKVSEGDVLCELEADGDDGGADDEDTAQDPGANAEGKDDAPASEPAQSGDSADNSDDAAPTKSTKAAKPNDGGSKTLAVKVPDIGDYQGVPVIEVLVADGDEVEADQPLVVLESDKATMEVPAPKAGKISALKVKEGDKLSEGDVVAELQLAGDDEAGDDEASESAPKKSAKPSSSSDARDQHAKPESSLEAASSNEDEPAAPEAPALARGELPIHASPSVRKFARKLGVDLRQVKGSARQGRILKEDVEAYVSQTLKSGAGSSAAATGGGGLPAQPSVDFSKFGPVEEKPLARIRKISAQHLHKNWLLVPHVTQTDSADITELEAFRKQANGENRGPKLTLLPFVIKAVAQAMKAYPEFNSSLSADGEKLLMKGYCHIGFAADTPNGLVVPVIRDVWSKGIAELAEESAELAAKARDGKLKPDEMKGGCFSISSLGGIGGGHFTPIVNAPEVGILGVSRASMQPVWDGKAFQPRLMCPLSLSYDHRVIDGAYAARFIVELVRLLSDIRRLSL